MFTQQPRVDRVTTESAGRVPETVIAPGVRVEGDFRASKNVVIEGDVVGSLTCGGHLTVGPGATITAGVTAEHATIAGRIEGNVTVSQQLDIKASATIIGDIVAQRMSVELGASIQGRVRIGTVTADAGVVINTPSTALEEAEA